MLTNPNYYLNQNFQFVGSHYIYNVRSVVKSFGFAKSHPIIMGYLVLIWNAWLICFYRRRTLGDREHRLIFV